MKETCLQSQRTQRLQNMKGKDRRKRKDRGTKKMENKSFLKNVWRRKGQKDTTQLCLKFHFLKVIGNLTQMRFTKIIIDYPNSIVKIKEN